MELKPNGDKTKLIRTVEPNKTPEYEQTLGPKRKRQTQTDNS